MKITIEHLAKIVNDKMKLLSDNSEDGRIKELSERRIRDYISKNLLHKGNKEGKYTYYDQSHIDKLIMLRQLQDEGIQERTLQKMNSTTSINNTEVDEDKENILSVLSSINNRSSLNIMTASSASDLSQINRNLNVSNLAKYEVKTKKEYTITENVSISISGNIKQEEQKKALENLIELFKNKL